MKLLLLEVYCDCESDKLRPIFCCNGKNSPSVHCFKHSCRYLSYSSCPNELAFSNDDGLIENSDYSIGLGGDMLPNCLTEDVYNSCKKTWKKIAKTKISEAYTMYMRESSSIFNK